MESLYNKITEIVFLGNNKARKLEYNGTISYLYRGINKYLCAIEYDYSNVIDEKFTGLTLKTIELSIEDSIKKVLALIIDDNNDLNKFCYIATDFLDSKNRKIILNNPYTWVDEWNNIFGNTTKLNRITDVLAELIVLREAYTKDNTFIWEGPNSGSIDIIGKKVDIEVKSTTNKNSNIVTINSAYQINSSKKQYLCLVRLEPTPYSITIDSLVKDLVSLGYSESQLEEGLGKRGYPIGSRTRTVSFNILSIDKCEVNENNFPIISIEELNSLSKSKNIINYSLTIDLTEAFQTYRKQ